MKEKFDVCIPTLNSGYTLEACLSAIKECLPYNRIIIADGHSSDNTIDIAERHSCEVYYCKGKLGAVRSFLIRQVKTDWFFFIDSDIVVNKRWFEALKHFRTDKTGAINGFGLPDNFLLSSFRKVMLKSKLLFGMNQRAFTSNTLLRTEAVRDIVLPDMGRTEDMFLQKKVLDMGWKWDMVPVWCLHLKGAKQLLKEAKSDFFKIAQREGMFKAFTKL